MKAISIRFKGIIGHAMVLTAAALLAASCTGAHSGHKSAGADYKQTPTAASQRTAHAARHFWDSVDFSDRSLMADTAFMEQNFANYIAMLSALPGDSLRPVIARFIEQASADTRATDMIAGMAAKYLYDYNSPMHDEDLFIAFAEAFVASPAIPEIAKTRTGYLLDLSPDSDITLVPVEDTADTATANLTTEDHSLPDIRIAGEQIALSDKNIAAVRAGYLPAISFSAYAGGIDYNEHAGHLFRSGSWFGNCFIGLSVNIPIFDANSRRHRIRQIQNERAQAVNRLEMMENSAAKDFSNAILQVEQNSEAYTTQLRSYRQAQDVYAITLERYREGIGSMTALLQDEMQLRSAQSVCVQALCQYRLARLELLRLSGNLHTLSD